LTDFQRAWESGGVLRLILRGYDLAYRWMHGLTDPASLVGPILRVRVTRHRGRPLALGDGTSIRRGDPIGDIHLDNERMTALHGGDRRSRWAGLAFRRAFHASLEALAEQVENNPRYHGVKAFTATTIFHEGTDLMGFEIRPLSSRLGARLVAAYERSLITQFHPLGERRPGRFRFGEARRIWISREELLRRYAGARSSARDTHA
jgi:peptidoglycan-N-acetylglucosamine deacetylase